jgi:DNA-binding winged helix-turn-helix (wHTH) protein
LPTRPMIERYIRFGPFQVDQQRQEVTKGGSRLKVQGKVYRVLLALLEKQGEVVTREEIRAHLWPADVHVNYDANVNTHVNRLRQALGDSSELYIETIPEQGYCLVLRPEFADVPFPSAVMPDGSPNGYAHGSKSSSAPRNSKIWITFGVVALILAGMLLGALVALRWVAHFAPSSGGRGF